MTDSKFFRLFTILMLYVAQGIPIGLLDFAIPAWMATNGATGVEIAYVIGLAGMPWALKFINGALIDRYTVLSMGRRRAWLIGAQFVMVGVLFGAAFIGPQPRDYLLLGAIAFAVYTAVVFQDVAADALAVDISLGSERGITGGLMSGGQSLGIAISAALAGTIIFFVGISAAFAACAICMAIVCTYLIWVRERSGEKRLPWSAGEPHPISVKIKPGDWISLLVSAFRNLIRKHSLIWLIPLFCRGMGYGFMAVAVPLIAANYAGWNEAQLGSANGTANLVAALVTMTVGGYLTAKIGAKPMQILTLLLFAAAVTSFALLEAGWSTSLMMMTIVIGWTVTYSLTGAPISAITMSFCDPQTGATQFSIYMAVVNQGIVFGSFSFAILESWGGIPAAFIGLAAIYTLAAFVVLFLRLPEEQTLDEIGEPVAA
ncbi:MFS transporter [Altererythrobacter sp. GH1-8]|uniref:MFS transporter n=1 Tax=Altererythrobacter sp. GH1-8 TaxID=3349333 RepID=UPI00374DD2BD